MTSCFRLTLSHWGRGINQACQLSWLCWGPVWSHHCHSNKSACVSESSVERHVCWWRTSGGGEGCTAGKSEGSRRAGASQCRRPCVIPNLPLWNSCIRGSRRSRGWGWGWGCEQRDTYIGCAVQSLVIWSDHWMFSLTQDSAAVPFFLFSSFYAFTLPLVLLLVLLVPLLLRQKTHSHTPAQHSANTLPSLVAGATPGIFIQTQYNPAGTFKEERRQTFKHCHRSKPFLCCMKP